MGSTSPTPGSARKRRRSGIRMATGHHPHKIRIVIELSYDKKPAPWVIPNIQAAMDHLIGLGTGAHKVTVWEEPV